MSALATTVGSTGMTPTSPFDSLPTEIIILIMATMHQGLERSCARFRLPIILSLTCKTWYLIVTTTPALWATIWLGLGKKEMSQKCLSTRLERSGNCLLDIEVDMTWYIPNSEEPLFRTRQASPDEGPRRLAKVLLCHSARWNQIAILDRGRYEGWSPDLVRVVHDFLPSDLHLPMLSSLKVKLPSRIPGVSTLFIPDTPRLHSLTLRRAAATQLANWAVGSLQELRLVYKDYDMAFSLMPLPQLIQTLNAACRSLEILHIQMVAFTSEQADEMSLKTIDMPNLSCFYLIGMPVHVIHRLLTQLQMPMLQKLVLSGSRLDNDWRWEPIKRMFPKLDHLGLLGFGSINNWTNRGQFVENLLSLAPNITKLSLWFVPATFVAQISEPFAFAHLQAVFVKDIKMRDWRDFAENRGEIIDMLAIDVGPLGLSGRDYENAFGRDEQELRHLQNYVRMAMFGRKGVLDDERLYSSWVEIMRENLAGKEWANELIEEDELWQWTRAF